MVFGFSMMSNSLSSGYFPVLSTGAGDAWLRISVHYVTHPEEVARFRVYYWICLAVPTRPYGEFFQRALIPLVDNNRYPHGNSGTGSTYDPGGVARSHTETAEVIRKEPLCDTVP